MTLREIYLNGLAQRLESINNQLKTPYYLGSIAVECMTEEREEIKEILKRGI